MISSVQRLFLLLLLPLVRLSGFALLDFALSGFGLLGFATESDVATLGFPKLVVVSLDSAWLDFPWSGSPKESRMEK